MGNGEIENPTFRRILLIGLGGSGQRIVLELKRRFLDTYGVVPPSVKMLCLDTDAAPTVLSSGDGTRQYRLNPHEFVHIKVEQPEVFISGTPAVRKWFVEPIPAGAITAGAGAVRQNGRLGLFHNLHTFLSRVDTIRTQLTDADLDRKMTNVRKDLSFNLSPKAPEIFVCGSLAGGTGSGTFLDVGILLREMMPLALIHGFFMLDWLYRRNAFSYRVGGNVYAALAELDNLQSIVYGSETFVPYEVDYGTKTVRVTNPPYTLFHLIDGRNENGENIADPNEVVEMVASAIYLSVGDLGPAIASIVDNLMTHIGIGAPRVWQGKYARYSSLGVSCMCYPAKLLHRWEATEQALGLCQAALTEAEGATAGSQLAAYSEQIRQDVDDLVKFLGLAAEPVVKPILDAIEPKLTPPAFAPASQYEVSDKSFPSLLEQRQQDEENESDRAVKSAFETHGAPIVASALATVTKKWQAIQQDPKLSAAYRREWAGALRAAFETLADQATKELNQATEHLSGTRAALHGELQRASGLRTGLFGNARKPACAGWAQKVQSELLPEHRRRALLEHSRVLLDQLVAALPAETASGAPQASEVVAALHDAEARLARAVAACQREFEGLKKKTNHILLGNGRMVIPAELRKTLGVDDEIHDAHDALDNTAKIGLRLEVFKRQCKISVADHYLARLGEREKAPSDLGGLADLFFDYTSSKLAPLGKMTAEGALEYYASRTTGRSPRDFITDQFNHLFRLAAPLWCYCRSLIDSTRRPHYDRILKLGVIDPSGDKPRYGEIVQEIKAKYGIETDHTFEPTHDPEHIWLLGYAAALPAYFVQTLQENRRTYEEEISPPFHVDRIFETKVPDIFPQTDGDNVALRLLGMAIVPDIDLIHDEKREHGHRFTWTDEEVKRLNGDEPRVWDLFRQMYDDVRSMPELREILAKRLEERCTAKSKTDDKPLTIGDLNPAQLLDQLRQPGTNRRVAALAQALSAPVKTAVGQFTGTLVPEDLQALLVDDLNRLLSLDTCIFDEETLRQEPSQARAVQELLKDYGAKKLKKPEIFRLNRLLLQETLPAAIGRSFRSAIESYVTATKRKLDGRDFSRLISARLTYREIAELEAFLSTKPGGYAMDIKRYIAGR